MLALDLEDYQGSPGRAHDVIGWALAFMRRVEARAGVRPMRYNSPSVLSEHSAFGYPALAEYPLWLPSYRASQPPRPAPWGEVAIWQFTDKGVVPGISGNVDLNRFNGSRELLLARGKPSIVEPALSADPRGERIAGLVTAVAHLTDVIVPKGHPRRRSVTEPWRRHRRSGSSSSGQSRLLDMAGGTQDGPGYLLSSSH